MLINLHNIGSNFGEVSCQTVKVHLVADVDSPQVVGRSRRVHPVRQYYYAREFHILQGKQQRYPTFVSFPSSLGFVWTL